MPLQLIVGNDGSLRSRDAMALAAQLASVAPAQLTVITTYLGLDVPDGDLSVAGREDALRAQDQAKREFPDLEATYRIRLSSSAARALHEEADELGADLIVMGTSQTRGLARLTGASVTEAVLVAAPCAVAVAPIGFHERPTTPLRRVGVAYVATADARRALRTGIDIAQAAGAELRLISAVCADPLTVPIHLEGRATGVLRSVASAGLEAAAREVPEGLALETVVADGDPGPVLIDASHHLDLLVLGSRAYGPMRRTLLGSVSARVVRGAHCPVIVEPRSSGEEHASAWARHIAATTSD